MLLRIIPVMLFLFSNAYSQSQCSFPSHWTSRNLPLASYQWKLDESSINGLTIDGKEPSISALEQMIQTAFDLYLNTIHEGPNRNF